MKEEQLYGCDPYQKNKKAVVSKFLPIHHSLLNEIKHSTYSFPELFACAVPFASVLSGK